MATASATKEALRIKKSREQKSPIASRPARCLRRANIKRRVKADELAERVADILHSHQKQQELSLSDLAKLLNDQKLKTSRGLAFTRQNVRTMKKRAMDIIRERQELDDELLQGLSGRITIQTNDFVAGLPSNTRLSSDGIARFQRQPGASSLEEPRGDEDPYKDVPLFGMF